LKLLLGFVGHRHLGRSDVLDLDGRGAIHLHVIASEADASLDSEFDFVQNPVLDPELDRAFGAGDIGAVAAKSAGTARTARAALAIRAASRSAGRRIGVSRSAARASRPTGE